MGMMGRGVDEGGIARRFWIKFKSQAVSALYSPFFVSLASGCLNSDAFLQSIGQDVHFLNAFAQAYESAEECADDEDDIDAIRELRKRVMEKLKMHDTLVREWGFEPPPESLPIDATIKYTDFLLATASGKVEGEKVPGKIATPFEKTKLSAYILGAIAPTMRLFTYLSKEIQTLLDPNDTTHVYKKWIDHYCSEKFEASALQTEELVDKLSVSLTGEELEVLEKIYHQALKLDLGFFSAQPVIQQAILPLSQMIDPVLGHLTIFCDFDLACSTFDSSAVLAEIAIMTAPRLDPDGYEPHLARMPSADLKSTWDILSVQYSKEYEDCMESIFSSKPVEKFDYDGLREALEQVASFERLANSRVIQSGVLKGINLDDIKRAGNSLVLKDGCQGFFQNMEKVENLKFDGHVVSYSWCGDFIRSALSAGGLQTLQAHSNELAYEESISTGEIITKIESPMDKLSVFNNILKENGKNDDDEDRRHSTVYIGGAVGDLLCLLEADIGIVIESSPSLRKLGDKFGVSFVPLFPGLVAKQRELSETGSSDWKPRSGTLYTASSWDEIHAFMLGS